MGKLDRLPWMITMRELMVIEDQKLWTYQQQQLTNGIMVYVPPGEKQFSSEERRDEILFLPITVGEFTDHSETYVGYRFLFISSRSSTIHLIGTQPKDGVGTMELGFEVARVFYRTRGKQSIVVDRVADPLFPRDLMELSGPVSDMTSSVERTVDSILSTFCYHYLRYDV